MLSGCPGTLDPSKFPASGAGGSSATGGGTGGGSPTGGSTGTGGGNANCTGGNDGATIVMTYCALTGGCHVPGAANEGVAGGLDLTVDANIGTRLVGVTSTGTADNGSMCVGNTEDYLTANSNPATGLLIDKLKKTPPCGVQMPKDNPFPLTATQQTCLIQWATTLTSP
jgi:hypothetical protein